MLSVSREREVDVQNVLSRELCAVPLDLFCSNGAARHTAKSNLLNKIEIKRYSLQPLWGNLGAIGTNFMAVLQPVDYSKFERFADEISAKCLSSFIEYELLVVVTDLYDF